MSQKCPLHSVGERSRLQTHNNVRTLPKSLHQLIKVGQACRVLSFAKRTAIFANSSFDSPDLHFVHASSIGICDELSEHHRLLNQAVSSPQLICRLQCQQRLIALDSFLDFPC